MEKELLPCPFCGGKAKLWKDTEIDAVTVAIYCNGRCRAYVVFTDYTDPTPILQKAIKFWNMRAKSE